MNYKARRRGPEASTIHFSLPGCIITPGKTIKSPQDVLGLCEGLCKVPVEMMVQILLNTKNGLIGVMMVGMGITDACLVDPKVIARNIGITMASASILVHNHPSGDTTPSAEDVGITKSVIEAAQIMDSKLLDHIIIGHKDGVPSFLSLRQEGLVSFS